MVPDIIGIRLDPSGFLVSAMKQSKISKLSGES